MGRDVYCRRFKVDPDSHGWICAVHWKMVPRRLKRLWARHQRQFRKHGFYPREAQLDRLWRVIWRAFTAEG
jgi:hypothetical protein